jgi:hypothetical protein
MSNFKLLNLPPFIFLHQFIIAIRNKISKLRESQKWNATWRSSLWVVFTVIFGLLQFGIIWEQNIVLKAETPLEYERIIMDGALLFFSTAIVASLTIDYFLLRKEITFEKGTTGFLFVLFPVTILILSISLFTAFYRKDPANINFYFVQIMELIIFSTTLIYAFFVKVLLYLKTESE